jgi:hypothetical protein
MVSSGMLRCLAPVRTDVSEEPSASIIRVTRIGELGTTHAAKKHQVSNTMISYPISMYCCGLYNDAIVP